MATTNIGSYKGTPITGGTDAQVKAQIDAINAQQTGAPPGTTTAAPQTTAAPSAIPTAPAVTPPNPQGVDDMTFMGMMNQLNTSFQQTNTLIDQKNAVLHASMGNPIDPQTLQKLPPDIQQLIGSGNTDAMRLQAQALNDQINNNSGSVASSIQFLTQGYETAVQRADQQKQQELDNLMRLAQTFVDPKTGTVDIKRAGAAFQSLYPGVDMSGVINQLQGMMPVSEYNKQFYQGTLTPPLGTTTNVSGNMSLDSAIVAQESGGDYSAISSAGALGKYQIMPVHLADVINPATGKPLDPANPADRQLFLNSPELQDQEYARLMAQLNTQYGGNMEKVIAAYYGGSYGASVVGTPAGDKPQNGGPSINDYVSQVIARMGTNLASPPSDAMYNSIDPKTIDPKSGTGRSYGSMYQNAWDMLYTGKPVQQYLGGLSGSSGPGSAIKNTIQNIAAAIEKVTGTNSSQFAALYKSNSAAATQNVERLARVESVLSATTLNFPRLQKLADSLASQGINISESDLQATQADILRKFGSQDAASYIELINTIRSDYGAAQAALVGSPGGQYFVMNAAEAIPIGLSSAQYGAIKDTLVYSSKNAATAINDEVRNLIGTSGTSSASISSTGGSTTGGLPGLEGGSPLAGGQVSAGGDYAAYLSAIGQ